MNKTVFSTKRSRNKLTDLTINGLFRALAWRKWNKKVAKRANAVREKVGE